METHRKEEILISLQMFSPPFLAFLTIKTKPAFSFLQTSLSFRKSRKSLIENVIQKIITGPRLTMG